MLRATELDAFLILSLYYFIHNEAVTQCDINVFSTRRVNIINIINNYNTTMTTNDYIIIVSG